MRIERVNMKPMMDLRKSFGILILFAFIGMALSVVCLASLPMNAMDNCPNGGMGATLCPFMSASVPAIVNATPSVRTIAFALSLVFALFLVSGLFLKNRHYLAGVPTFIRRQREKGFSTNVFNVVLELISNGILHPRIFAF